MLYYLVTALHILVCIILILVVLLQSGKGADLAGAFGGGATQTAFGSRGPASLLSKVTTGAAVLFMVTSVSLSMMGTKTEAKSILDVTRGTPAPAAKAPAVQPPKQAAPPTPDEIKKLQQEIEAKQKQAPMGVQVKPEQGPAQGTQQPSGPPAKETKPKP